MVTGCSVAGSCATARTVHCTPTPMETTPMIAPIATDAVVLRDCLLCGEEVLDTEAGQPMPVVSAGGIVTIHRAHYECIFRSVMGGIGHHEDHSYWCVNMGDPDMGLSYRESARRVVERFSTRGDAWLNRWGADDDDVDRE